MKEFTAHKPKAENLTTESRDQPQRPSGLLSQVTGHLLASFASVAQSDHLKHPSAPLLLPLPSLFIFSMLCKRMRTKEHTIQENQESDSRHHCLLSAKRSIGSMSCAWDLHDTSQWHWRAKPNQVRKGRWQEHVEAAQAKWWEEEPS